MKQAVRSVVRLSVIAALLSSATYPAYAAGDTIALLVDRDDPSADATVGLLQARIRALGDRVTVIGRISRAQHDARDGELHPAEEARVRLQVTTAILVSATADDYRVSVSSSGPVITKELAATHAKAQDTTRLVAAVLDALRESRSAERAPELATPAPQPREQTATGPKTDSASLPAAEPASSRVQASLQTQTATLASSGGSGPAAQETALVPEVKTSSTSAPKLVAAADTVLAPKAEVAAEPVRALRPTRTPAREIRAPRKTDAVAPAPVREARTTQSFNTTAGSFGLSLSGVGYTARDHRGAFMLAGGRWRGRLGLDENGHYGLELGLGAGVGRGVLETKLAIELDGRDGRSDVAVAHPAWDVWFGRATAELALAVAWLGVDDTATESGPGLRLGGFAGVDGLVGERIDAQLEPALGVLAGVELLERDRSTRDARGLSLDVMLGLASSVSISFALTYEL